MKKLSPLCLPLLFCGLNVCASTNMASFEFNLNSFTNTGSFDFIRRMGSTPSSSTGPSKAADGTNYYVFLETSSGSANASGNTAYLTSPLTNAKEVVFSYHMYGENTGTLAIEVKIGSGSWQRIWQVSGQQHTSSGSAWTEEIVQLSTSNAQKQFRFVGIAAGGWKGDMAIDQVRYGEYASTRVEYKYDALGRLVCVEDSVNGDRTYQLDAAGNRENFTVGVCND